MGGYITLAKFLLGRTPPQIESGLGLPLRYLAHGAMIYRFLRLPMAHEYDYELTARYPGGLAYNPAHSNPDYPPGSGGIHQWAIKDGVYLPVDTANVIELGPTNQFPYSY